MALAPSAQGDHHFVSISEVFPGTAGQPGADFVELRMYSSGQENFHPATDLVFYNSAGGTAATLDLLDVDSGDSQRTLLAGTPAMESLFGVQADTEYSADLIANAGGGVCLVSSVFGTIDCVAWGAANVAGAGTSAPAIAPGASLARSMARGCNTLLEAGDDTGSSADDFGTAVASPEPNSAAPLQSSCPNTRITKKPAKRSTDRTPKFKFSGGDDYDCSLDGDAYSACGSPFKPGRLARGKHKLKVFASEPDGSVDGTPAKYGWRIKRRR